MNDAAQVLAYYGVKVFESPHIEPHRMIAMGDIGDLPDDWEAKTDMEKIAYAVAHGAVVMVNNIGDLDPANRPQNRRTSQPEGGP